MKASSRRGSSSWRTARLSTGIRPSATSSTSERVTPMSARSSSVRSAPPTTAKKLLDSPSRTAPSSSHEKSLLDPGRQRRVGGLGGGDEARVLGVRVLASHVQGHARDALLVASAGERREGLDRHEEAGRGERQAESRLGVRRRVQGEGHGPARGRWVDGARLPLQRRRLLEPPKVLVEAHEAAPAVRPQGRVGARGEVRRRGGEARVPAHEAQPRRLGLVRRDAGRRPSRPIFAPDGPSPRGRASATLRPAGGGPLI